MSSLSAEVAGSDNKEDTPGKDSLSVNFTESRTGEKGEASK